MNTNLRHDLLAIILEEAYGYKEATAQRIAATGAHVDHDSYDAANRIVDRFEARCSRIEG